MDKSESALIGKANILANRLLGEWQASPGLQGVLINLIEKGLCIEDSKDAKRERAVMRKYVLGFLFSDALGVSYHQISSKMLTPDCWYALYIWIKPTKDQETSEWRSDNINFRREILLLADHVRSIRSEAERKEMELLGQLGFDV